MGLGAVTLAIAVLGVVGWLTFLVTQTRVRRRREAAPQNQSPFLTDDELESKRLNKVLAAAFLATAVMAIVMPVYYLNESGRQVASQEKFAEIAEERGEHWFEKFQCGDCHGADGAGGGASFIEPRSGITTAWAAPALNDITFRFTDDEIRYWIVFGRQGTPMPAWGVEGGGPLNSQQVDELLAYIDHLQVSQFDAVAAVDGKVAREVSRLAGADDSVAATMAALEANLAALMAAPAQYEAVSPRPATLIEILSGTDTCTAETAAAVDVPCANESPADSDRDGVSDAAEIALNTLIADMLAAAPPSDATTKLGRVDFDPSKAFTTADGSTAIPDLEQIDVVVDEFENIVRTLRLTLDSREMLESTAIAGLEFVRNAAESQRWAIDFEAIAAAEFDGNVADAQRGAALYSAYCARCHTSGYSAGVAFTQEAGSGALGPSLRDGRSSVQFPDEQAHLDFVIKGSVAGELYGLNGIGRGWMPGFGTVLSENDLMLIIRFERALR